MALNYAKGAPIGSNGVPLFESPAPVRALVTRTSENAITSSVINLGDSTTVLEVTTGAQPAFIKWIATTDTTASVISAAGTANFDHTIPANWVRRFVIPQEVTNNAEGSGSVVGVAISNGLFRRYAWKTGAIGSVMSTEHGLSNTA